MFKNGGDCDSLINKKHKYGDCVLKNWKRDQNCVILEREGWFHKWVKIGRQKLWLSLNKLCERKKKLKGD